MTSPIEGLFPAIAALLVMAVAILTLFLVGNSTQTVDAKIDAELGETKAYTSLASVLKSGSENTHYERLSLSASGREKPLNERILRRAASDFTYATLEVQSEYGDEKIFEKGSREYTGSYGTFKVPIPVRGGKIGSLNLNYEVN